MWIFKSRIGNFTQTLLKSLTIPQAEYGCAIWSLNDQKLNLLRGVQRRFTSRILQFQTQNAITNLLICTPQTVQQEQKN